MPAVIGSVISRFSQSYFDPILLETFTKQTYCIEEITSTNTVQTDNTYTVIVSAVGYVPMLK